MEENNNIKKVDWNKYNAKYNRVPLKFNKKENSVLMGLFNQSGEKYMGTFIKNCVFYGGSDYKKEKINHLKMIESNKDILKQIKKIGNNLNQIAIKLHLNNSFSKDEKQIVFKEIEDLKKIIYTNILKK